MTFKNQMMMLKTFNYPEVKIGDDVRILKLNDEQHFTDPPPRFSEASLVKKDGGIRNWSSLDICKYHFCIIYKELC